MGKTFMHSHHSNSTSDKGYGGFARPEQRSLLDLFQGLQNFREATVRVS